MRPWPATCPMRQSLYMRLAARQHTLTEYIHNYVHRNIIVRSLKAILIWCLAINSYSNYSKQLYYTGVHLELNSKGHYNPHAWKAQWSEFKEAVRERGCADKQGAHTSAAAEEPSTEIKSAWRRIEDLNPPANHHPIVCSIVYTYNYSMCIVCIAISTLLTVYTLAPYI